jgi:hypothetical protein
MKKPFANNEKMKGNCGKCPHRRACKTPCEPVKQYLAYQNRAVFEKTYMNEDGQQISIIYSRPREFNLSAFKNEGDTDKNRPNKIEQAFSTENESAFAHFEPNLKQTRLFVDKFFHKLSIEDLSVKYDMEPKAVYVYYKQAKRRVFDVLEALDSNRPLKLDHYWKKIEARSGSLPKGQRWFLMNKIFELTPQQISEIEGLKNSASVSALIIRVSDQLKAGEIELFPVSEIEALEAKSRLDAVRERRRKHRANNIEKMRE